jgi:hypothetical protein
MKVTSQSFLAVAFCLPKRKDTEQAHVMLTLGQPLTYTALAMNGLVNDKLLPSCSTAHAYQ